jgi:hypothetical protein
MKRVIQAILLVWFIVVSAAILIPSYQLLFGAGDPEPAKTQAPTPPAAPSRLTFDPNLDATHQAQKLEDYKQQLAVYTEQIKGYTQEVTAYTQQVAAHKVFVDTNEKSTRRGVFELVAKGTLVTMIGTLMTGLIAYVFTSLGAGVVNNMMLVRNGKDPQPLQSIL